jgi:peptide/nickel transport system permease protein
VLRFLLNRTVAMVAMILLVTMAVSLVLTALPGDAARLVLGPEAPPERYEAVRQALGLHEPWPLRFFRWLAGACRGDLGFSFRYPGHTVAEILRRGLAVTLPLAGLVAFFSFVLGVLLGTLSVSRLGGLLDLLLSMGNQVFLAIPEFWLGILLVGFLSLRLHLFPAGGFPGWGEGRAWLHLALPLCVLALPRVAYFARLSRAVLADVLFADFVRTAWAKGLAERAVLFRHTLRPALVPLVAGLGLTFSRLLAGALVVEQVFSLPGLGGYAVEAAFGRDVPLLLGMSALVTAAVVVASTAADLAYGFLDPRIRAS